MATIKTSSFTKNFYKHHRDDAKSYMLDKPIRNRWEN